MKNSKKRLCLSSRFYDSNLELQMTYMGTAVTVHSRVDFRERWIFRDGVMSSITFAISVIPSLNSKWNVPRPWAKHVDDKLSRPPFERDVSLMARVNPFARLRMGSMMSRVYRDPVRCYNQESFPERYSRWRSTINIDIFLFTGSRFLEDRFKQFCDLSFQRINFIELLSG